MPLVVEMRGVVSKVRANHKLANRKILVNVRMLMRAKTPVLANPDIASFLEM